MADIIDKCNINLTYRSDCSIIALQICLNTFTQGKGFWKFNNSLLKNEKYLNLINNIICKEKLKYALPMYNLNFIKMNDNIQMSIDSDQFLEVLFLRIRGETIEYSSHFKKSLFTKEQILLDDLKVLKSLEATSANIKLLEDKQIELENLRKHKINGYITRTCMQWLQEGRKNNKKVATPNWHSFKYSKRNSARG